uniref:Uncharacterized protein n=1 Tax=Setaria digitata TaxID=48799 RepID=A0A915PEA7_9BILA
MIVPIASGSTCDISASSKGSSPAFVDVEESVLTESERNVKPEKPLPEGNADQPISTQHRTLQQYPFGGVPVFKLPGGKGKLPSRPPSLLCAQSHWFIGI